MNKADRQRIAHIKTYCEDIADFTDRFGKDFRIFTNDRAYFNAVAMCVLQIGELANALSEPFREETKKQRPVENDPGHAKLAGARLRRSGRNRFMGNRYQRHTCASGVL